MINYIAEQKHNDYLEYLRQKRLFRKTEDYEVFFFFIPEQIFYQVYDKPCLVKNLKPSMYSGLRSDYLVIYYLYGSLSKYKEKWNEFKQWLDNRFGVNIKYVIAYRTKNKQCYIFKCDGQFLTLLKTEKEA